MPSSNVWTKVFDIPAPQPTFIHLVPATMQLIHLRNTEVNWIHI